MPSIYLSPSTQELNPYIIGGSEEYYMNLLADALEPYLLENSISFKRNDRNQNAVAAIRESNAGDYDLHLALHSNASPASNAGGTRGIDVYYYPGSVNGQRGAEIFRDNFKEIYPLPEKVRTLSTTRLGEVRQPKAPSVFLEIGYHDNEDDAEFIVSNIPEIAKNIAMSLTDYFRIPFKMPTLYEDGKVQLYSGFLNLREEPSISSKSLALIPNGTRLSVMNMYNGWYKTNYNGLDGYVNANYIKID